MCTDVIRMYVKIGCAIAALYILPPELQPVAFAEEPMVRPMRIIALADRDPWQRDETTARQSITKITNFVSEIFQKEFGLAFILAAIEPWSLSTDENKEIDLDVNLAHLKHAANTAHQEFDIVLGFSDKQQFRCVNHDDETVILKQTPCPLENKKYYYGLAQSPGKVALLRFSKFAALHEVGHLFGADHTSDNTSIMGKIIYDNTTFDDTNKEIIRQTIKEKFSTRHAPR